MASFPLDWHDAQLFSLVVETGSFTGAADRLGVRQSTVSRRIVELEEKVGAQLFERGREGATPTALAARLIPAAQAMAQAASELEALALAPTQHLAGKVRVTAAPGVAADILVPFAASLRHSHPALHVEVLSDIELLDLSRGHADLAVRNREPVERTEVGLGVASTGIALYAMPEYVATLPCEPSLADIDFIGWAPPFEHVPPTPQLRAAIENYAPIFTSNSFLVQLRALECGMGAMVLPRNIHCTGERRRLVEIPVRLPAVVASVHVITAKHAQWIPRIRYVGEALVEYLRGLQVDGPVH